MAVVTERASHAERENSKQFVELLDGARAGRADAWAQLYQDYFSEVLRHVHKLVADLETARDLTQETFARAMVSLARFDGRSRFSTWLHGIALNLVRQHWRKHKTTARAHAALLRLTGSAHAKTGLPESRHLSKERAAALQGVLDQLPEHLREAFVLRELDGIMPAEAAEILGISPGNVAVRMTRARQLVQKKLISGGWLDGEDENS